jgi:hypothetical protein
VATAYDYSRSVEEIKAFIRKQIYKVTPSYSGHEMGGFKFFKGEQLEEAARSNRLFDIMEDDQGHEKFFQGNGTKDYDVKINIDICYAKICYAKDSDYTTIGFSDAEKIKWQLESADKSSINPFGFNFFETNETPTIEEADEDNEWRIMTIPIMARLTVTFEEL